MCYIDIFQIIWLGMHCFLCSFCIKACDITGGLYLKIPQKVALAQHLLVREQTTRLFHLSVCFALMMVFSEQWVFLPDSEQRSQLVLPPPAHVDYRAACFCHRNLIEIGYVCSVCLSSECHSHLKKQMHINLVATCVFVVILFPFLFLKYSATSAPSVQLASKSQCSKVIIPRHNSLIQFPIFCKHALFFYALLSCFFFVCFRTAFKIQLPQMVKPKKKKLKQAAWGFNKQK